MVTEAGKTDGRRRAVDYSKRYWWAAAIVVPIVVALVSKWPVGNGSPVLGTTYIASMTVIENQYQQFVGQPLSDPDLKQKIQRAIELGTKRDFQGAIALFEQIPENARVPALWNDLGVAYTGVNDHEHARAAFEKARAKNPDDIAAKANLSHLDELKVTPLKTTQTSVSDREVEPNNDFFHPNLIPLNATVGAAVSDSSDVDFFAFKTPRTYRDVIEIVLDNDSTTLQPGLWVYNADRSEIGNKYNGNAAGNVSYSFVAPPDSLYYVRVSTAPYTASFGAYRLKVQPKKAYDAYEPNDDIFHASSIAIGKTIEAGIMDAADVDFYKFLPEKSANFVASLESRSTTLQPGLWVYNADRSEIGNKYNGNAAGNVSLTFSASANGTYYVRVGTAPYTSSSGNYVLTIRPE